MIHAFGVAFLALLLSQQTGGSIEGAVLSIGNDQPVRAQLSLVPATDATPVPPRGGARGGAQRPSLAAGTDNTGRFAFKDVPPGAYRLGVVANGFVKQEYGQLIESGKGKNLNVGAGQAVRDIVVHMTPTGTVTGRVSDDARGIAVGADVQILKVAWSANAQKTLVPAGTTRVDDRGEYRLFGLTPGRYYLAAGTLGRPLNQLVYPSYWGLGPGIPIRPPNNNVVEQFFGAIFYPGVTDLKDAAMIEVPTGGELRGIDFVVPRQESHDIRGRVIDARSGQATQGALMSVVLLNFRDEVVFSSAAGGTARTATGYNGRVYDPARGFELIGVSPGQVVVTAEPEEADVPPREKAQKVFPSAFAALNITNSDVEDLVLTVEDPLSISGSVVLDGQDLSKVPGLERMKVGLMPLDGPYERWLTDACARMANPDARCIALPRSESVKATGTFQIGNMKRGRFKVTLDAVPPDYYVKEVRFDKKDILNSPLEFTGSVSEPMEVVLSAKPGQISGSVGSSNTLVVLIPDANRTRIDLFKTATTDVSGRFTIRGITPGDYKAYAWEAIEPFAYFDPDFVQKFQANSKPVHIAESDNITLDLKLIPAR